jgi:hypothetical protein
VTSGERHAPEAEGRPAARWGAALADVCLAGLFALITLLSRWPYRARMLYNWDAVQFALALREFDVAKHQPHPPGYLLHVGLARLVDLVVADATFAYVALSMIMSAATTAATYWLARRLYDRATAVTAAALLAVSPLFWFYGSVGLSYAGEALGASVVALLAWRALQGDARAFLVGGLVLGLAGGLRQSVLVLLFPLWLSSGTIGLRSATTVGRGVCLLGVVVLGWLLPMVWLTGGFGAYWEASTELYGSVVVPTSVLGGSLEITLAQTRALLESVAVGLGPLAVAALAVPAYVRRRGWGRPERFLLAWIAPPALFYSVVHFGQAGYVLTFLPALVVLLSRALLEVVGAGSERLRRPHAPWALAAAAVVTLVVINTGFFVSARPMPRDFDGRPGWAWLARARDEAHDWIMSRTAAALREHEAVIRTYVDTIRAVYDPADTVLITELGNRRSYPWLRHAMYYLPEYPIYQIQVGARPRGYYAPQSAATMILTRGAAIRMPPRVRRLVWFVDHWDPSLPRPAGLQEVRLSYGRFLYVLPLGREAVEHAGYAFVPAPTATGAPVWLRGG